MKIVEFLLNNLLPIFFAVLCLIAALKSIEIVKRSEVELMTKRRKEIERFESDTRKKYDELPEDLLTILNYARKLGASLVWLDRDADEVEGLPVYEW